MSAIPQTLATRSNKVTSESAHPFPLQTAGFAGIKAFVLLAGTMRSGSFAAAIQRSPLDLPVDHGQTIFGIWRTHTEQLAARIGWEKPDIRIMVDGQAVAPSIGVENGEVGIKIERDPHEFRGTGGVLFDLATQFNEDDYLLVASGAQLLVAPLPSLYSRLSEVGADVALVADSDEKPSGLMLIRCGALSAISAVGFVDFKEQALPVIAKDHEVAVIQCECTTHTIRTAAEYLAALRLHHKRMCEKAVDTDAYAEDWKPTFSLVEPGADVAQGAKIYDSVVLAGGKVEAGGVVVRSVVCPGGVVGRRQRAIDMVVTSHKRP